MAILESGEMYVEAIYLLSLETGKVRGKDISDYMGFSRPSISRAITSLKEKGLVIKDKNGFIRLTEGGQILAKHIYERNELIVRHLISLGVDESTATQDARQIERFISDKTFDAIRAHLIKNGA
jgi:Mn-dependent DtxR family transcriptional regulator